MFNYTRLLGIGQSPPAILTTHMMKIDHPPIPFTKFCPSHGFHV